jgi:RNA polymerase sigma-70 factor (ECF subfamily)
VSDTKLVEAWVAGDAAAGDALLRHIQPDVYALCYRILGDGTDAEDAVQETFTNLVRSRNSLRDVRDFRKWLATVATNAALNLRKKRGRESPAELFELPAPVRDTIPADSVELEALKKALDSLPPRHRLALHYRYRMGLPLKQVAEMLEVSEANVRVILHRAIAHARLKAKEM